MNYVYFDIETAALPESELLAMMPTFEANKTLKDPAKIAADIEAKKQAWLADAALDPLTGQVLAIGVDGSDDDFGFTLYQGDERALLSQFWEMIRTQYKVGYASTCLAGFNILSFDLPFLIKRSWKHGIKPPTWFREGRYWSKSIIDLREVWTMGDKYAKGSLDAVAKHLGLEGKNGDGKDFAKLWLTDRDKAISYLKQDVLLVKQIAERIL